jgi:catechol 2,3-dioxygenase-like lactoylglutathione lyase family enzyme
LISGIDHVQLAAPPGCEAEARRFFGGLLGLSEIEKPAALAARGGVWFRVGTQQLHVGVDADFSPARKAHPAFRLETPATLSELAERLDARFDSNLPGFVRFYAEDPWGNRLEFLAEA